MDFLDHVCLYSVVPAIHRWELKFKGTVWCPGWTPIRGRCKFAFYTADMRLTSI